MTFCFFFTLIYFKGCIDLKKLLMRGGASSSVVLTAGQEGAGDERHRVLPAERVWWRYGGQERQRQDQSKSQVRSFVPHPQTGWGGCSPALNTVCPQEAMPFAVVGSDKEYQVNGKRVLGRKTAWGIVEGECCCCEVVSNQFYVSVSHKQVCVSFVLQLKIQTTVSLLNWETSWSGESSSVFLI